MVATVAFGMGIHNDNIRFVIHACPSKSIDGYYQVNRHGQPSAMHGGALTCDCPSHLAHTLTPPFHRHHVTPPPPPPHTHTHAHTGGFPRRQAEQGVMDGLHAACSSTGALCREACGKQHC
jgi:hypothetical protein